MIRKILTTTAIAALLTSTAMAQSTSVGTHTDMSIFNSETETEMMHSSNGYFAADANQILASTLLGKTIYTSNGDDAEAIGDVNDVVMSPDGKAQAVVVGVGGFLGMGEKEVAVDFTRLNWVDRDDERRLVMSATADELKTAPEFDRATITGTQNNMAAMDKNDGAMESDHNAKMKVGANDGKTLVDQSTLSAEDLIGTRVYGSNDSDLGEIGDVILSTNGQIEAYIIDVGGFLGLGEKPVALDAKQLDILVAANGDMEIHTPYTEQQLKEQPAYSEKAYKDNPDQIVIR